MRQVSMAALGARCQVGSALPVPRAASATASISAGDNASSGNGIVRNASSSDASPTGAASPQRAGDGVRDLLAQRADLRSIRRVKRRIDVAARAVARQHDRLTRQ